MAEEINYKEVPEADRQKAQDLFKRGKAVGDSGQFEYAIEMYLSGLNWDPEDLTAHQALREISLKRKASGGRAMGMMDASRIKRGAGKDEKAQMLAAERLLAFDPGNTTHMLSMTEGAFKAGCYDTMMWIGPICLRANCELEKKADYAKYIALKDLFMSIEQWRPATEALQLAASLRPHDMDLQTELKNLGALNAMAKGNYASGNFRGSLRDKDTQEKLIESDKDIRSVDSMERSIAEAEAEWRAEPHEIGKLMKYVTALEKTESFEHENRALEVLEEAYQRTRLFRLRKNIGELKMKQLKRMERQQVKALEENPGDEGMKKELAQLRQERTEFELSEYELWADNYPTDMNLRFEVARRLYVLKRFDEAIPVFQQARQDPKLRFSAALYLGRSFLDAQFPEEAIDTLQAGVEEYQGRGDELAMQLTYWLARALEEKGERDAAIKRYSQVAQINFNYLDVQQRIKKLRAAGSSAPPKA